MDQGLKEITAILQGDQQRKGLLSARWLALKCMEEDRDVMDSFDPESDLGKNLLPVIKKVSRHIESTMDDGAESIIADYRYGFISAISRKAVVSRRELRLNFSDKLDRVLTNQLLGPAFLFVVLYLVYQFVFWASEAPVAVLEDGFGWLGGLAEANMAPGLLRSLLVSGILDGVGGVLGFAPLIMFMFFAIAFMEDTGYMARVAYIMDRVLRIFGLHGNSVLALIVSGGISGGCAVPGVMATRTLKDPQARLATILVVPMMNCGAKLPVYAVLIGAFFTGQKAQIMFALTIISWGSGPSGGKGAAQHGAKGRAGSVCHGASPLPAAHFAGAFDPHLGAHLAIREKGRHRDFGGQHPDLGGHDLSRPAGRPERGL